MATVVGEQQSFQMTTLFPINVTMQNATEEWRIPWIPFCAAETDKICTHVPLGKCKSCAVYGFWIFFVLILLMSVWIILGNVVLLIYVYSKCRSNWGRIRASLAVADLMGGFYLIVVTLPKVVWTVNSTPMEIYNESTRLNSGKAKFAAITFLSCLTSFMYVLTFMSYHRFAAMRWPIHTKHEPAKYVIAKLTLVWATAIATSTYSSWFPDTYDFKYFYFAFQYLPSSHRKSANYRIIAIGSILPYSISYITTTILSVATGIVIKRQARRRKILSKGQRNFGFQAEKSAYIMLALIGLAFTITAIPALLAYSFDLVGKRSPVAVFIANYMLLSNGAINLVVYYKKDNNFKSYLKQAMKSKKRSAAELINSYLG